MSLYPGVYTIRNSHSDNDVALTQPGGPILIGQGGAVSCFQSLPEIQVIEQIFQPLLVKRDEYNYVIGERPFFIGVCTFLTYLAATSNNQYLGSCNYLGQANSLHDSSYWAGYLEVSGYNHCIIYLALTHRVLRIRVPNSNQCLFQDENSQVSRNIICLPPVLADHKCPI